MLNSAKVNLTIEQNATFNKKFRLKNGVTPVNLTGCTFKAQVRASANAVAVLYEFSTANAGVTVDALNGEFTLTATDEQTTSIKFLRGVYDILMTNAAGEVTRLVGGEVTVVPGVTK